MPDTQTDQTRPTFGAWVKSTAYAVGNFFIRYPLATAATVLLLVGAVALAVLGVRVQLGGLLGRLWGRKQPDGPVVLPPPPGRVDDKGAPIPPGQPDEGGFVQVPVVLPIKPPGILSDPSTVTVNHDGKDVVLPLPKGVRNEDVKEVIVVSPNVYQVANSDRPSVDTKKLLEDLDK